MADPRAIVPVTFAKRLTQAVTYGLTGGWFSPQLPLQPQHQETAGRRFDYLAGYNISTRPRRDSGIDFYSLRNFAKFYDILRILIEKRKDQISNFDWSVVPTDEAVASGENKDELTERAAAATKFLKFPDGRQKWNTWLRSVAEDMIVLDAIALWPVYEGKQLLRLDIIDPSTIKLVIDESGRTPEPPFPAYQQVLHGVPTADFLKTELMYFMSNPSSDRIYGLSKVEQILITIQIGLRREMSQLQFFTEGNVPAALMGAPATWNMNQIASYQVAFDALLAGDTAARRKLWIVPGETAKNIHEFKSEDAILKAPFDEWLVRIMCFTFGIAPTPFINQVNRATAFTAQEEARDEGLGPQLTFIKSMMDTVIHNGLRLEGVEFKWSMEQENDPETQAAIDDKLVRNGLRSLDELRQRDGLEPYGIGAMIYLPTGPVSIQSLIDGTAPVPGGGGAAPGGGGNATEPPNAVDPKTETAAPGAPDRSVSPTNPTAAPGKRPKPKSAAASDKTPGKKETDVDVTDDHADALDSTKKPKDKEARAGSSSPFRKRSTWHGYPAGTICSPKAAAAQERLVKAARRARPEDRG
jgi:hypothetical protein